MGLFGGAKTAEPLSVGGAIPVATPVPMEEETTYQFPQAANGNSINSAPFKATVVTHQQHPAAQQQSHSHQQHTTTTTGGELFVDDPMIGRRPTIVRQCPNCRQMQTRTRTKTYPGWQTWTASAVLCFIFWPISWIPLVLEPCQETEHYCVSCGAQIGRVTPFSDCCVTHRS